MQGPTFQTQPPSDDDDDDDEDDEDMEGSFSPDGTSGDKFAQYPRPKIVPVDYNKKKQVCVCEQCGGSWSRKEYYYHHKVNTQYISYTHDTNKHVQCKFRKV